MTISKWIIVLMCTGSAVVGSVVTTVVHNNSASELLSSKQIQQGKTDAAFEARPSTRGGVKGY